jgi:hypothetical protein
MADFPASGPGVVLSDHVVLRAALAAYLGATAGRPRCTPTPTYGFLRWCADHDLDPLTAVRVGHRAVRPLAAAPSGARDPCSGTHGCRDGDLVDRCDRMSGCTALRSVRGESGQRPAAPAPRRSGRDVRLRLGIDVACMAVHQATCADDTGRLLSRDGGFAPPWRISTGCAPARRPPRRPWWLAIVRLRTRNSEYPALNR